MQLFFAIFILYMFVGYALSTRLFSKSCYTTKNRLLFSVPLSVLFVTYFSIFFLKSNFFNSIFLWVFFIGISLIFLKIDILLYDYKKIKEEIHCIGKSRKFATIILPALVFLLIICTHYIKQTILFFPSLSVSWIYYALAQELAQAEKFLDIFIQYAMPLPRIYSYLAFDVFNAALIKMTSVSDLLFMYIVALVNLVLCITFLYFFLRKYFSLSITLIAVVLLCSYPLPYGGLAPRVWSHYWPEVLSFALATACLHMIMCGVKSCDYRLAVLNGFIISLIYIMHPVPFAVLMMLVVLIIVISACYGCEKHFKSYIVYFGITFTLAVVLGFLLPLMLTGSNALVEYIRGAFSTKGVDGQAVSQADSTLQYLSFFSNGIPTSSPGFKDYFHWGRGAAYYQWPLALFSIIVLFVPLSFFSKLTSMKKKIVLIVILFWLSCLSVGFLHYFIFDSFTLKRAGFYRFLPYTLFSIVILAAVSIEYINIIICRFNFHSKKYIFKYFSINSTLNVGIVSLVLSVYAVPAIALVVNDLEDFATLRQENFAAYEAYHWIKDNTEEDDRILTSYVSTGAFRAITDRNSFLDGGVAPGVKYKGALPNPNKNFLDAIEYFKSGDYTILEKNKINYLFLTAFPRQLFGLRSYATSEFLETVGNLDYLVLVKKTKLFELYRVFGDVNLTIIEYQKNVEKFPFDVKNYLVLARLYRKLSRTVRAEQLYGKAIELSPDRADIRLELGQLYQQKKNFSTAKLLYLQAVELAPDDLFVCYNLVQFFTATKYDPFLEPVLMNQLVISFERYINEHPSVLSTYYKLAELYQVMGQVDNAKKIIDSARRWQK